jgi:hypothetical protein
MRIWYIFPCALENILKSHSFDRYIQYSLNTTKISISGVLTELFNLGFSEDKASKASVGNLAVTVVDQFFISK